MRNWAVLLLVRAIAEAAALVATANGAAETAERKAFLTAVCAVFGLDEMTATYLGNYFDKCTAGKAEGLLQAFREACTKEYKTLALRVALSVAQADGFVDENETRVLRSLAELLGLDPNKVYEEINAGTVGNGIGEPWWEVLAVSSRASIDEVTFAYRKLAMQFHPDVWVRASESQRQAADARMKRINTAFDRAKRDIYAREKRDAAATSAPRKSAAAKPTVETREKENAEEAPRQRASDAAPAAPRGTPSTTRRAAEPATRPPTGRPSRTSAFVTGARNLGRLIRMIRGTARPRVAQRPTPTPSAGAAFPSAARNLGRLIRMVCGTPVRATLTVVFCVALATVLFLDHNRSAQHSASSTASEPSASLPNPSAPENVEAAAESPVFSQGLSSIADSDRKSDARDASRLAVGDATAPAPNLQLPGGNDAVNYYQQAVAKAEQSDYAGAVALWSRAIALVTSQ